MSSTPFFDVRMKGFRERTDVEDVLRLIDGRTASLESERVPTVEAAGRVLTERIVSLVNVPNFARAAMDGYAVRSADSGARRIIGTTLPGESFAEGLQAGQAVRIMTGAAIPTGADTVIPAERATEVDGVVRLTAEALPGRHIIRVGEDVAKGTEVLVAGRRLRPEDAGLLAAIGIVDVAVVRRPRVAIVVTGGELLPPGSVPTGTRIVDSNSPMLAAFVRRDGGIPLETRYVPDELDKLREAIRNADADAILISGGSSVGQADYAPQAVAELGELAVHGIAVKPAGPTGIGFLRDPSRIAFLLPGNPGACHCAYDLIAGRAIRRLGARGAELPYPMIVLPLASPISSAIGRFDYVRVKFVTDGAEPIGGASRIGSAVAADGFILIPPEIESLPAGEAVLIYRTDIELPGDS